MKEDDTTVEAVPRPIVHMPAVVHMPRQRVVTHPMLLRAPQRRVAAHLMLLPAPALRQYVATHLMQLPAPAPQQHVAMRLMPLLTLQQRMPAHLTVAVDPMGDTSNR
ncbi:MAG: hypothetical protein WAM56_03010 [Acidobacteriaceae bacterium]